MSLLAHSAWLFDGHHQRHAVNKLRASWAGELYQLCTTCCQLKLCCRQPGRLTLWMYRLYSLMGWRTSTAGLAKVRNSLGI